MTADIAMCQDAACPSRERCYRATAVPDGAWQTYGEFVRAPGAARCAHFWDNGKGGRER